jgi:hypothetical protein
MAWVTLMSRRLSGMALKRARRAFELMLIRPSGEQ